MSDFSQVLGNKGAKHTLTDPDTGRVYQVSFLTQANKSAFEAWLKDAALDLLLSMKGRLPEADWQAEFRTFKDEVASGKYLFFGEVSTAARQTPDGMLRLASILFGISTDELADLTSRYPDRVKATLELVVAESAARVKPGQESGEGNVQQPR